MKQMRPGCAFRRVLLAVACAGGLGACSRPPATAGIRPDGPAARPGEAPESRPADAASTGPEASHRLVLRALLAVSENDLEQALALSTQAVAADGQSGEAFHTRAAVLWRAGRPVAEGLPDLERAVELEPEKAAWHFELAGKYWEVLHTVDGASPAEWAPRVEEQISRAIELDPARPEYLLLRARCRRSVSRYRGAAEDFRALVALAPAAGEAYLGLGTLYATAAKLFCRADLLDLAEEALASADRLAESPELSADDARLLPHLAFELAMVHVWRATTCDDAAQGRAQAQRAIDRLLGLADTYPDRVALDIMLGQLLLEVGNFPRACSAVRSALGGLPEGNPAHAVLGPYLAGLEQEACGAGLQAVPERPDDDTDSGGSVPDRARGSLAGDLSPVPADLPDEAPPARVGEAWTAYGLWQAVQDARRARTVTESAITVHGYVVPSAPPLREGAEPAGADRQVWFSDCPGRGGLFFPLVAGPEGVAPPAAADPPGRVDVRARLTLSDGPEGLGWTLQVVP